MKVSKVALIVVIMIMSLVIVGLILFISLNDVVELTETVEFQQEKIDTLETELEVKDFHYTTASMEIDNLEQIISSKNELITQLKVKEEVLELYKEAVEYSFTYVYYAQSLLDANGIPYAEFIAETVLEDNYFEEIEEQVEHFEE